MKNVKTIVLVLLFVLPFTGVMRASHAHSSILAGKIDITSHTVNFHHTANPTHDADRLVAEDDDGDDFTETLCRNIAFTGIPGLFMIGSSQRNYCYTRSDAPPAIHSFSFLRVFRI